MKRNLLWLAVLVLFSSFRPHPLPPPATPSAGVYLFIDGITTGCGVDQGHADEVALSSVTGGFAVSVSSSGGSGSPTIGQPSFADYMVSKMFDRSSLRIQHYSLDREGAKTFEIRYYDGVSPTNVYKIVLSQVIVSTVSGSNATCSGGCPGVVESYSFNTTKITWHNFKTSPAQVLSYDLTTNEATFVQ
jgi:type VI protein secretion system component Hcp